MSDHFLKNSYSWMRVHLAVQIFPNTMKRMIETHAEKCGGIDEYKSILKIIEKSDRFVDISNATGMNKLGVQKGCECIDSPYPAHLQELLSILMFFCTWKKEAGENVNDYLPWQSHKDFCWTIFGIAGILVKYLKKYKSQVMKKRTGGPDDCEHEFAGIKQKNNKPTHQDCKNISSCRTGVRTCAFTTINKSNTSGDTSIFTEELTAHLEKKRNGNNI